MRSFMEEAIVLLKKNDAKMECHTVMCKEQCWWHQIQWNMKFGC
jgi:hypothetical protein